MDLLTGGGFCMMLITSRITPGVFSGCSKKIISPLVIVFKKCLILSDICCLTTDFCSLKPAEPFNISALLMRMGWQIKKQTEHESLSKDFLWKKLEDRGFKHQTEQ